MAGPVPDIYSFLQSAVAGKVSAPAAIAQAGVLYPNLQLAQSYLSASIVLPLAKQKILAENIIVIANPANTALVWVGTLAVTNQSGIPLSPGQILVGEVDNSFWNVLSSYLDLTSGLSAIDMSQYGVWTNTANQSVSIGFTPRAI